jgi:hypothetical protein
MSKVLTEEQIEEMLRKAEQLDCLGITDVRTLAAEVRRQRANMAQLVSLSAGCLAMSKAGDMRKDIYAEVQRTLENALDEKFTDLASALDRVRQTREAYKNIRFKLGDHEGTIRALRETLAKVRELVK